MSVVLKYTFGNNSHGVYFEYLRGSALSREARIRLASLATFIIFCSLALYTSVLAERPLFVFIFLIFLVSYSAVAIPTLRLRSKAIAEIAKSAKAKEVELTINEEGIKESANGIVSIVQWSSVVGYETYKDHLFIKLVGGLWAIVSLNELKKDSDTIEKAVAYLDSMEIPKGNLNNA